MKVSGVGSHALSDAGRLLVGLVQVTVECGRLPSPKPLDELHRVRVTSQVVVEGRGTTDPDAGPNPTGAAAS